MSGAASPYRSPTYAGAERHPRRLVTALAASLAIHAWIASEVPSGLSPRGGVLRPAMIVRLAAPPVTGPASPIAASTSATAVSSASPAISRPKPSTAERRRSGQSPHRAAEGTETAWLAPHHDPTYYAARQLDTYPALLSPLDVLYPERAIRERRSGRVLVLLLIDADGKVDDVTVVEADPPGHFEHAARAAFETARFSAGRRSGVPVKSRVLIHLDFDPRDARTASH